MSEKKKKNVLPVEEKTPEKEPEPEEPTISLPFEISDKAKAQAEALGIPMTDLLNWAASVEYKFQVLAKGLTDAPHEVVRILKAEATKAQQQRIENQQGGQPRQGGRGEEVLLSVLGQAMGGGSNPMQEKMMNMMFEKTMMGMDLSNALTKAMIIKLAPELADSLAAAIKPKV